MIVASSLQFANALVPINVTDDGITTERRLVQNSNTLPWILVRFEGRETDSRLKHSEKTYAGVVCHEGWVEGSPKVPTESGITIDERLLHPANAERPMLVTRDGITMEARLVLLVKVPSSIAVIRSERIIETSLRQELKALDPMLVTESGTTKCTRPVPTKLLGPIVAMVSDRVADAKDRLLMNASSMPVTERGITTDVAELQLAKDHWR